MKLWLTLGVLLGSAIASYLLGSISFAVILSKVLKNMDVRAVGSGNAGMTNAFRAAGKKAGILTFLGDFGKSAAAVCLGRFLVFPFLINTAGLQMDALFGAYFCGLFCILGHIYPLYFGFRGGKGVVTALGTFFLIDWKIALIALAIFAVLLGLFKMVSLGSIAAAFSLWMLTAVFYQAELANTAVYQKPLAVVCSALIGGILIVKHKSNIKRILNGTENKISKKKVGAEGE
ncbi:MAG: glycerol-3-phosphate 1-O-acyltransferase PlsY [Oscillospiraceae bacterium]|nr:glycerol-3-phosphate 1-O-acyltransferase PlsY [Oscillospiraceae bacterium]